MSWPFDQAIVTECELDYMGGRVRPQSTVMLNGYEMASWGPRAGWLMWDFYPEPFYPLDIGTNALEFTATLDDGSTISATIGVICDPTLQPLPGFIRSLAPTAGTDYKLVFDGGGIDDQPDGYGIIVSERFTLDVAADALFLVYEDGFGVTPLIYTAAQLAEALADCTPTNDVPYEILVDDNKRAYQGVHFDGTIHFCLGE